MEQGPNPAYRGVADRFNFEASDSNITCDDRVRFTARIDNGHIIQLRHDGKMCCLTAACCDVLCESFEGAHVFGLKAFNQHDFVKLKLSMGRTECVAVVFRALRKLYEVHQEASRA